MKFNFLCVLGVLRGEIKNQVNFVFKLSLFVMTFFMFLAMSILKYLHQRVTGLSLCLLCGTGLVWFGSGLAFGQERGSVAEEVSPEAEVRVTWQSSEGRKVTELGRLLVRAQDGGILFEERDGRLRTIIADAIYEQQPTGKEFQYFSREELKQNLLAELPKGFETYSSKRYLLVSNLSQEYSDWVVRLLEQLSTSYHRDWKNSVVKLKPLEAPLIVMLFARPEEMAAYSQRENLPNLIPNKGFYSPESNRVVLVDLSRNTPLPQLRGRNAAPETYQAAMFNAATIAHEAAHQLCYNTGLMNRYADNPLWLSEGLAMYYETPHPKSRSGWKGGGKVNESRLLEFDLFRKRNDLSLTLPTLFERPERFTNAETAGGAYAEAWMLTFYLMKKRKREFGQYLKMISEKPPLLFEEKQVHLEEFEAILGDDWKKLGRAINSYANRLR